MNAHSIQLALGMQSMCVSSRWQLHGCVVYTDCTGMQQVVCQALCTHLLQDIMTDPVVAADGITYERRDIQGWLDKGKPDSPWTRKPLDTQGLTPNLLVLQLIKQFKLEEPE